MKRTFGFFIFITLLLVFSGMTFADSNIGPPDNLEILDETQCETVAIDLCFIDVNVILHGGLIVVGPGDLTNIVIRTYVDKYTFSKYALFRQTSPQYLYLNINQFIHFEPG